MNKKAVTYSTNTVAELLMITPRRLQQLTKEGYIIRESPGKYVLAQAVQGYIKYLKNTKNIEGKDFYTERVRLTSAQADQKELEVQKMKNALVPVDLVINVWVNLSAQFKTKMLSIPSKLAKTLTTITDTATIDGMIRDLIYEALEEVSNGSEIEDYIGGLSEASSDGDQ